MREYVCMFYGYGSSTQEKHCVHALKGLTLPHAIRYSNVVLIQVTCAQHARQHYSYLRDCWRSFENLLTKQPF